MSVAVIIPAAGSGRRFGSMLPKQFLPLAGIPILARTLLAFERSEVVNRIVVATHPSSIEDVEELGREYEITKLLACVPGGNERQHSIFNALLTPEVQSSDIVLVHDAVRPFIDDEFIRSIVEAALQYGAAVPGLAPRETVKEVDEYNRVLRTHDRSALRMIQTPQGFRLDMLLYAYGRAQDEGFLGTDDASVVEYAGYPVHIVDGREENIKITTPPDMRLAEILATHYNVSLPE